jgi:hypothetical protein
VEEMEREENNSNQIYNDFGDKKRGYFKFSKINLTYSLTRKEHNWENVQIRASIPVAIK